MNIDRIDITENDISFTIYPLKNEVLIEGKMYPIEEEKILELLRIVMVWDKEYIDNTYYDGNRYEVRIIEGNNEDVYKGTRNAHANYEEFSRLIREIYDRV